MELTKELAALSAAWAAMPDATEQDRQTADVLRVLLRTAKGAVASSSWLDKAAHQARLRLGALSVRPERLRALESAEHWMESFQRGEPMHAVDPKERVRVAAHLGQSWVTFLRTDKRALPLRAVLAELPRRARAVELVSASFEARLRARPDGASARELVREGLVALGYPRQKIQQHIRQLKNRANR